MAQQARRRARMNASSPEATRDDSRSPLDSRVASGTVKAAHAALAFAGVAGVVALVLATFLPVIEIAVAQDAEITADLDRSLSGFDRHSIALVLIGLVAGAMHAGALARGSRPAMLAVAVLGAAALAIAVVADAPDLDKTGPIGELYEEASASAGAGFYAETLGGALLLIAGGGMLALGAPTAAGSPARPRPRRERGTREVAAPEPVAPPGRDDAPPPERAVARARPATPALAEPADGPEPAPHVPERTADVPEAPGPEETDPGRLSFEDRLREARERAARRRGS
jgi:hypothetical protein